MTPLSVFFFMLIWFLLGLLAYYIGESISETEGERGDPWIVFLVLAGPLLLLGVVFVCVKDKMEGN